MSLIVLFLLLLPGLVAAQGLTDVQYTLLHDDITITHASEFQASVAAADYQPIADAYNLLATGPFWVWRTSLTPKEIYEATAEAAAPGRGAPIRRRPSRNATHGAI